MASRDWQFGPFARQIAADERLARLRALRTIVHLHCGPRGTAAARAIHMAESTRDADDLAITALERLDPLDRRRVLASYQATARTP